MGRLLRTALAVPLLLLATAASAMEVPAVSANATNGVVIAMAPDELIRAGKKLAAGQDHASALEHFSRAAAIGNSEAAFLAAQYLLSGQPATTPTNRPVEENLPEAIRLLNEAAETGHAPAMRVLGACLAKGRGVPADRIEACKWWVLAARRGDSQSAAYYEHMSEELGPDGQAEVERRALRYVQRVPRSPVEAAAARLRLNGISGPESRRIALINNQPFAVGDQKTLPVSGTNLSVRCLEIGASAVRIQADGLSGTITLAFESP